MQTLSICTFWFIVFCGTGASDYSFSGTSSCDVDDGWTKKVNYDVDAERVYYVACIEEEWDYCPNGAFGVPITSETDPILPYMEGLIPGTWCYGNNETRIGSKYIKSVYREFTNSCFDEEKVRTADQEHLGVLGPALRALTGEKMKIFYKNKCSIQTSMHFHGLSYDKSSEGAAYPDGDNRGDIISPYNGTWIYLLHARKDSVDPGTSSKMWIYHSHVDEPKEVMSGLLGAVIITKKGKQRSWNNLMPKDVDREFVNFFVEFDENDSWYIERNRDEYAPDADLDDGGFRDSNDMHSINGYLFGGLDSLIMSKCEKVRWYTASFGDEIDGPHSPHWHGNIVRNTVGENLDTLTLIPGTTMTVTMKIDRAGTWLYHCHVHDHIYGGMITTYSVNDVEGECKGDKGDDDKDHDEESKEEGSDDDDDSDENNDDIVIAKSQSESDGSSESDDDEESGESQNSSFMRKLFGGLSGSENEEEVKETEMLIMSIWVLIGVIVLCNIGVCCFCYRQQKKAMEEITVFYEPELEQSIGVQNNDLHNIVNVGSD